MYVEPLAPDRVTATRNTDDDSVVVTWSNLTLIRARGWLIHYTIYYWDTGSGNRNSAKSFMTDGVMTSHTFSSEDFNPFRTYNVVVRATTGGGEGAESAVFTLQGRPNTQPGTQYTCSYRKFTIKILSLQ